MTEVPKNIKEIRDLRDSRVLAAVQAENTPVVFRGLAENWPLIAKARTSSAAASDYLLKFYAGAPVTTFTAPPAAAGRISYTDDLAEKNFKQKREPLDNVLRRLLENENDPNAPTIYVGSRSLDQYLPGLREENSLPLHEVRPTVRIWIGNRTTVAAHYDTLENIACVCAGRRRFTLFPPDQLPNLYIGPIDFTPAGQSISLVDLNDPDFDKYPRFAEALKNAQTAELEPGDAIYIPAMWWHAVEGLEEFNVLINHWWRDVPDFMGAPGDALLHAILSIRELPKEQRNAWQIFFNHYVFEAGDETAGHIPADRRGPLGDLDDEMARRLRAMLRNNLNR
ncbi:MAG: cupin-like domain-containing protein [Woeseia sp.]|nr:cupin-like domain-containing protein [Woeseia sp.]